MNDDGAQTPTLHQGAHDDSPRGRDRVKRRPLAWWDRLKFVFLAAGIWMFLAWREVLRIQDKQVSSEQLSEVLGVSDSRAQSLVESLPDVSLGLQFEIAADIALKAYGWLLVIAGIEVVRQLHYFVSERWAGYHRFWTQGVFGGFNARAEQMNDWNRFRLSRALKWLFWALVVSLVLAQIYETHPLLGIFQAPVALFQALPFVVQLAFFSLIIVVQFVALFWFLSRGGTEVYFPEDIETRFRDVWGQDHVLDKVKENIIFLEDPESIEAKGGYLPGGVLLWGPPGTGKTLMAEAVAGETGKPFVFVEPSAFINMFLGVGALKVKALFRKLRKLALRYGGVIVFFDEADSLGSRGSVVSGRGGFEPATPYTHEWSANPPCNGFSYLSPESRHLLLDKALGGTRVEPDAGGLVNRFVVGAGMGGGGGGMGTLQALLTEMSGLKKPRGFWNRIVRKAFGMRPKPPPKYRILIMMASNMPQALDPALLRPGRIDRMYHVGYPSKDGRKRTYEGYFAKIRHNLTEDDIEKLATQTPYATGASIKDLVNEALIQSIRVGRRYVTWQDIIKARLLQSIGPPEAVEYGDRERHSVAIHEACHAVAAYRVSHHRSIDIATIEKSQTALGMVKHIPREERFTKWKDEYDADLVVALAALAGERIFYGGDNASGVSGDLASSTGLALEMEAFWGMGETLGSQAVSMGTGMQIQDTSRDVFETELGRRAERRLTRSLERATEIVEENRYEVLAVAHALEINKTITGDDVAAVIEGHVGPLVDGRPYRTTEFRRMVDEYHDKALRVHQEHAQVEVPVPGLEPASPGVPKETAPGFAQGLGDSTDRPV